MKQEKWPEHSIGGVTVQFVGRQGDPFKQPTAIRQLQGWHPNHTMTMLRPPTNPLQFGLVQHTAVPEEIRGQVFGTPSPATWLMVPVFEGDGAIVAQGQILVAPTRDCPYVILTHEQSGTVVALHAGRDQIFTNRIDTTCKDGVVASGIKVFQNRGIHLREVQALIIGGISAENFRHDQHPQRGEIEDIFNRHCGREVFVNQTTLTLDLRKVIKQELLSYGVLEGTITIDCTCPYTNSRFGSKRGETDAKPADKSAKTLCNWVVVQH